MATAELVAPNAAADPTRVTAVTLAAHQEKMATRRVERAARLPDQIRCLDAEHAANVEAEKPKFRFRIRCTIQEHDPKLKRMVPIEKSGEVDAQNEKDAWAIFCDKWAVRTGPNFCNRVIEKLSRRRAPVEN